MKSLPHRSKLFKSHCETSGLPSKAVGPLIHCVNSASVVNWQPHRLLMPPSLRRASRPTSPEVLLRQGRAHAYHTGSVRRFVMKPLVMDDRSARNDSCAQVSPRARAARLPTATSECRDRTRYEGHPGVLRWATWVIGLEREHVEDIGADRQGAIQYFREPARDVELWAHSQCGWITSGAKARVRSRILALCRSTTYRTSASASLGAASRRSYRPRTPSLHATVRC
jgi:hypothetical protein